MSVSFEVLLPQWDNAWQAPVSDFHSPVVSGHRRWKRSFVIAAKQYRVPEVRREVLVRGKNKAA